MPFCFVCVIWTAVRRNYCAPSLHSTFVAGIFMENDSNRALPGDALKKSNLESHLDLRVNPNYLEEIRKQLFTGPSGFRKEKEVSFTALTLDTHELWCPRLVPLMLVPSSVEVSGNVLGISIIGQDCFGVLFLVILDFSNQKGHLRRIHPNESIEIGDLIHLGMWYVAKNNPVKI